MKKIMLHTCLFIYFTGNDIVDEAIRFAVSGDAFNYYALNQNNPVIDSANISATGGLRDPHILRREDGQTFYMVATDMISSAGWDSNRAMVLLKSENLVDWTSTVINIQETYPGNEDLKRVWAPQTIYDPEADRYMVFWSMKHGDGPESYITLMPIVTLPDLKVPPNHCFCRNRDNHALTVILFSKTGCSICSIKQRATETASGLQPRNH